VGDKAQSSGEIEKTEGTRKKKKKGDNKKVPTLPMPG